MNTNERVERNEDDRVALGRLAEPSRSDPSQQHDRDAARDEREQHPGDDRRARHDREAGDEQRVEREERGDLRAVVAVVREVDEPDRIPLRERTEEQVTQTVIRAKWRYGIAGERCPDEREDRGEPDAEPDPEKQADVRARLAIDELRSRDGPLLPWQLTANLAHAGTGTSFLPPAPQSFSIDSDVWPDGPGNESSCREESLRDRRAVRALAGTYPASPV